MGRAGGLEQRRRGLRHLAGVDQVGCGGRVPEPGRVEQRPLGAQQVEAPEPVLVEQLRRPLDPVPAEDDDPVGVAPDEVPAHSPEAAARGFTTGRRFGSTRSRRCS